jgi:hypothetical protein
MRRRAGIPFGICIVSVGLGAAVAGCGRGDTGAHVYVRLGQLQYDELRLSLTVPATGETVVDPATAGRYVGPFRPGDQDTIVYLPDALDGSQLHCEATALRAGMPIGAGAADMLVARGTIKVVEIVMAPPGAPMPMPKPPPDPMPTPTDARKATGAACSLDAECLTGHCVDGVCCESDCQTACRSCALPDTVGLCRPVPGGAQDPRGKCEDKGAASCQGTGLCDVAGDCAVYPAGTVCQAGGCSDNARDLMPTRLCDGAGKCEDGKPMHCPDGTTCAAGVCS